LTQSMRQKVFDHQFHLALGHHGELVTAANRYVDDQAPWALRKTDPERMATVLYVLAETIRNLAMLAHPVMPDACDRMLGQLAVEPGTWTFKNNIYPKGGLVPGTALPKPEPVFAKLVDADADEGGA